MERRMVWTGQLDKWTANIPIDGHLTVCCPAGANGSTIYNYFSSSDDDVETFIRLLLFCATTKVFWLQFNLAPHRRVAGRARTLGDLCRNVTWRSAARCVVLVHQVLNGHTWLQSIVVLLAQWKVRLGGEVLGARRVKVHEAVRMGITTI